MSAIENQTLKLTFIGFGEVAATLFDCAFAHKQGLAASVYMSPDKQPSAATNARLRGAGLSVSSSPGAISEATIVLSAVTPASAVTVAQSVSPYLKSGTFYVDVNSVSGQTILKIADCVERRGARCVDAAIMGPVPLYRNAVPIFLSGTAAEDFHSVAEALGLTNTSVVSKRVGDASSLKMLWSVITKGSIALFSESLIAAHRLGLLEQLRYLLKQEYGNTGSDTMILRMLGSSVGGASRRLDEMAEAARTLRAANVPPWVTETTIRWLLELSRMPAMHDAHDVAVLVDQISASLGAGSASQDLTSATEKIDQT